MTISIRGIGWLTKDGYGRVRSGFQRAFEPGEGAHARQMREILVHPFKNFGRLDAISRMTAYAVSLALLDAGIAYAPGTKQDIGIIGTNTEGSLQSDIEYFTDYVTSGRTLSRGNLFIYTLPSSPVGQAAIYFGFLGPLLYVAGQDASLISVLDTAAEMVLAGETPVMVAGRAEPDEAVFFVLSDKSGHSNEFSYDLADVRAIVKETHGVARTVREIALKETRR